MRFSRSWRSCLLLWHWSCLGLEWRLRLIYSGFFLWLWLIKFGVCHEGSLGYRGSHLASHSVNWFHFLLLLSFNHHNLAGLEFKRRSLSKRLRWTISSFGESISQIFSNCFRPFIQHCSSDKLDWIPCYIETFKMRYQSKCIW